VARESSKSGMAAGATRGTRENWIAGPSGAINGARVCSLTPALIAQCLHEIAAVENQLRRGHPDIEGLCLALADWSAELRTLLAEQ
jgi:hypothetical protein